MKKFLSSLAFLLLSVIMQAQISIGNGTMQSYIPFNGSYNYTYSQSIYNSSFIGTSGDITGITYYTPEKATFVNSDQVQVWLGHTTKSTFANSSDFVPISEMTKVYEGKVTFAANKMTITFSTAFSYDKSKNLVIAINEIAPRYGSYGDRFLATSAAANSSILAYNYFGTDAIDPTNIGNLSKRSFSELPNITLLGIDPPKVAPQCTKITAPADKATGVEFLPRVVYNPVAGATKYLISVGTTPGGTEIADKYNNEDYLDYYFSEGLDPETTYYVTVIPANQYGEAQGCSYSSFTTGKAVANDRCSTAEIVAELPFGKNVDASWSSNIDGPVTCGGVDVANDGVWYEVTGDGGEVEISVTPTEFWDPQIVVKEAVCDAVDCIVNVNDNGFEKKEVAKFQSEKGKKYFVNIGSRSPIDFAEGTFYLAIKSTGALGTVDAVNSDNNIKVYPNPVSDRLFVNTQDNELTYQILSISGQLVQQGDYSNQGISVNNLQKGNYIIVLQGEKIGTQSLKFVKK